MYQQQYNSLNQNFNPVLNVNSNLNYNPYRNNNNNNNEL